MRVIAGVVLLGVSLAAAGRAGAAVAQSAPGVARWERVELTVELPESYANPFDPAEISVTGEFRSPSGRATRVPGFYYQGYERSRDAGGNEALAPVGKGVFKVRFAGDEVGVHHYRISARDAHGAREVGRGTFLVTAAGSGGYVRRSAGAPLYFQLDSGAPYFPIGENMCWPGGAGTYDYDAWMSKLAENGGNYIRLWLINEWNKLGLEHLPLSPGDGNGLGRYDQEAAWRIDYVMEMAERLGMRVLICIDSFNSLDAGGDGQWRRYPYNAANGGSCETTRDFFTNAEAKRLFRQRLRYLVARWGYSTSVLAWEFWNEVDIVTGYDSATAAAWHEEMARALREMDPWGHLITTSYANTPGDPAVDGLAEMDFVQSHNYGSRDAAEVIGAVSLAKTKTYGKPHYFGEFGTDAVGRGNTRDPEGIHLHNGLWAAMMSNSAGTAMLWWWDNYVDPCNLYGRFAPVAAFARGVDWVKENYGPAKVESVSYAEGHEPAMHNPVAVSPEREGWTDGSPCNRPHTYRVGNDGSVSDFDLLSRVQHGVVNHPTWHNPATFLVDYPGPGRFEVVVSGVSGHGGARLVISLDGAEEQCSEALTADFPDTRPEDTETLGEYDGVYGVEVPAGPHTIVVEDTGNDWFYAAYRLTNYGTKPNLRVLALSNDHSALVWVQNRDHTWWRHANGLAPQPANASEIALGGLTPGRYEVQRWDTWAGTAAETVSCDSADGVVVITTPAGLTRDAAYKVRKR